MSRLPTLDDLDLGFNLTADADPSFSSLDEPLELDDYSVFTPLHYEPNYQYPLLIWLHGAGDDEYQLRTIMPLISMQNFVAVGPRGTQTQPQENGEPPSYQWRQTESQVNLASHRVFHCIDDLQNNLSINPQRIFIGGLHSGGTMALRIALNHPEKFAGVITIGGHLPRQNNPLACIHGARKLPLLIANGLKSKNYSETELNADLRLFHAAGIGVSLRLYPCHDELMTNMLEDMNRWMMQQICPDPAFEESSSYFDSI